MRDTEMFIGLITVTQAKVYHIYRNLVTRQTVLSGQEC